MVSAYRYEVGPSPRSGSRAHSELQSRAPPELWHEAKVIRAEREKFTRVAALSRDERISLDTPLGAVSHG